jgi:tetratricopeptide (TPR) repeat protein
MKTALSQGNGLEKSPELQKLNDSTMGNIEISLGGDDIQALAEELAQKSAKKQENVNQLLHEASADWTSLKKLYPEPGEEGRTEVESFIQKYTDTEAIVDDKRVLVSIPEINDAQKWIERSDKVIEEKLAIEFAKEEEIRKSKLGIEDEFLFQQAKDAWDTGDRETAIRHIVDLVKTYPESERALTAYAMAGTYYEESANTYKAILAYRKVAQTFAEQPGRQNQNTYIQTRYKLAWCYHEVEEYSRAIDIMKKFVDYPQIDEQMKEEALQSLVKFYISANEREAGKAYFREVGRQDLAQKL